MALVGSLVMPKSRPTPNTVHGLSPMLLRPKSEDDAALLVQALEGAAVELVGRDPRGTSWLGTGRILGEGQNPPTSLGI